MTVVEEFSVNEWEVERGTGMGILRGGETEGLIRGWGMTEMPQRHVFAPLLNSCREEHG